MAKHGKLIRASEIGEYIFCARAWWLRVEGVEAGGWSEARERGTAWHREHGRGVESARRMRRLATVATTLAAVLALVIFALWWWRG
jgi:CRISPR/Cas system-associated exonuclease Cas4 (RecB family)